MIQQSGNSLIRTIYLGTVPSRLTRFHCAYNLILQLLNILIFPKDIFKQTHMYTLRDLWITHPIEKPEGFYIKAPKSDYLSKYIDTWKANHLFLVRPSIHNSCIHTYYAASVFTGHCFQ